MRGYRRAWLIYYCATCKQTQWFYWIEEVAEYRCVGNPKLKLKGCERRLEYGTERDKHS